MPEIVFPIGMEQGYEQVFLENGVKTCAKECTRSGHAHVTAV